MFHPTPGYTYFAIEEEFDAIPLICFLVTVSPARKVAIFLDDLGCLPHYQTLVRYIMIIITTTTEDPNYAEIS